VLLERIRKEQERLFEEEEISKPKEFGKLSNDEELFVLPSNWTWTQLGNTGIGSTGKTPSTNNPEYFGGDIPFIGPGQINESGEISSTEKTLTESGRLQSEVAKPGDILMVCIGGSIGKSAIAKSIMAFNQQINSIRLFIPGTVTHPFREWFDPPLGRRDLM
jgi:type I restriction enzyme S subunit